ncbi:hypothetical protein PVAND_001071 [Polypedilum vanderplanki]|uniref:Uncharacterized protein n=1 Tax=Polypedilum vanderplanki TaxID=319348 RepID=A0A9J6BM75_POLVA|nr:hypothetical protein PVAND_001071 [Polypedilum vanderplanki]
MKILIFYIFLSTSIHQILCDYQPPNAILNLTQVLFNRSHTIAEYNVIPSEELKFPFNLNEKLEMKFYDRTTYRYFHNNNLLHIYKSQKGIQWIKESYSMKYSASVIAMGFNNVQQTPIGDILSEVFDCWDKMEDYVMRIFFYNRNDHEKSFFIIGNNTIEFPSKINIFIVITEVKNFDLDEDKNFNDFLRKCLTMPINQYFITFGFFAILFIFLGIYLYELFVFIMNRIKKNFERNTKVMVIKNRWNY